MKIPKARVRFTDAIEKAIGRPGEWVLYKEMSGMSALQTCRKYNSAKVEGGVDGLEFGVDGEDVYVRYAVET